MEIKREFVLREVAGDTLLIPTGKTALDMNGMLTLNEAGAEIWRLLPEARDENEIVEKLLSEYDAPAETVRRDVSEFLGKLRELKIL